MKAWLTIDLLRRDASAVKKPFFRPSSLNFSPNMPDFGCKICLHGQKKDNFPRSKCPVVTSLLIFLIITSDSFSQISFPSLSPKGRIEQNIGLTNLTIDYERPAARGRKIFGGLVKYDKLWRTGAGNCTKITFSKPVIIDNKKVNQGTYSIFTIPGMSEWTVILNKDTTLYGSGSYSEKNDLIRFKAKVQYTDRHYESLTIDIDVIPNNAVIYIAWERTQISFRVDTEIDKMVNESIEQNLLTDKSEDPEEYAMAAEYYYFLNKNLDRAKILIDKAIARRNEAWYYRQKIDILERQKKYKEAIECTRLAISLDQNRADWDAKSKKESKEEYEKRIDYFNNQLKQ